MTRPYLLFGIVIWLLALPSCGTQLSYNPSTDAVTYNNWGFNKEFAVMSIEVTDLKGNLIKKVHIEGYKSDGAYVAEAVSKGISEGIKNAK